MIFARVGAPPRFLVGGPPPNDRLAVLGSAVPLLTPSMTASALLQLPPASICWHFSHFQDVDEGQHRRGCVKHGDAALGVHQPPPKDDGRRVLAGRRGGRGHPRILTRPVTTQAAGL